MKMQKLEIAQQFKNANSFALLSSLAGSAFFLTLILVLLSPVYLFYDLDSSTFWLIVIGTAISGLSTGFWAGKYIFIKSRYDRYEAMVKELVNSYNTHNSEKDDEQEEYPEEESPLGEEFIKIVGTSKIVRVTDGLEMQTVVDLARSGLDVVSQRAIDSAGILTRDPSVTVNAGTLMDWLIRNEFVELVSNNRYRFTLLGKSMLQSVSGTTGSTTSTTTLRRDNQ